MKIEIRNRFTDEVIFSHAEENNSIVKTIQAANLSGANLSGANLSDAYIQPIKDDYFDVLKTIPNEVPGLIDALKNGRVNGTTYSGECACLVGTIANIKQCDFNIIENLRPNSSRPIERFFLGISKGDTPETNQISAIVTQWAEEFLKENLL